MLNVLLEALVLKKFVISTNCSTGPSEILSKGKGGILVPINNYKYLANKIIFFNKNRKKLKKKLLFARKNLVRFDLNQSLIKYSKIIDKT